MSEILAQSERASSPGMCHAECHRFEPRILLILFIITGCILPYYFALLFLLLLCTEKSRGRKGSIHLEKECLHTYGIYKNTSRLLLKPTLTAPLKT